MARDKLKKKIATYKEGVAVRNRLVEQAKLALVKEEAELSKLKNEEKILKGLVEQLKGIFSLLYTLFCTFVSIIPSCQATFKCLHFSLQHTVFTIVRYHF